MVAAVPLVFLLAWLDLRREQARALDDFTDEQRALAGAFAAALQSRVHGSLDASQAPGQLLAGLPVDPARLVLLVDGAGRSVLVGPGDDRAASLPAERPKDVRALLERMGEGGRGALTLGRPAAAALGLEPRLAVAGFAPVPGNGGPRWSVAVVASAMRVRDRARVSAWRLLTATGMASLLVGLFGWVVTRQQRRSLALAEALRLAEATAALRERSEKIVDTIPIGVLALDGAGRVTSVNPYLAERQLRAGGTLGEALPRATAEERAALEALLAEARERRGPVERGGLRVRFDRDQARDVDAYAIPLAHPLADADCFLVLSDRTEMRVLERNLARAEKLATIGTLAAGVAHEVGTPLGIISGRAEQLLAKMDENDPMRKGVSSILAQVDKVSTTIRQLLDFARVRPIEASAVTPTQALETARALLEHRFRQARVELAVEAPPTVPAIAADPGQLEQVFVNLLINAVDACAAGGHVRASAAARGDRVCFEIADDGQGIAPEHLPSVLDPFFTTKKRGQGTGLGLTIAADIVKNHGGALEIDSAPGRGTTVRVHLPIARSA
jgi:signal transduction histidine kinase